MCACLSVFVSLCVWMKDAEEQEQVHYRIFFHPTKISLEERIMRFPCTYSSTIKWKGNKTKFNGGINYKITYLKSELFLIDVVGGPCNINAQFLLRETLMIPTTMSYEAKNTKE